MNETSSHITIRLIGESADDGRIYVNSPDLRGFHFVLEAEEDPYDTMKPTLEEFIRLYFKAELRALRPALTPRQFHETRLSIPSTGRAFDYNMIAEMA